jgi:hypothetical protein
VRSLVAYISDVPNAVGDFNHSQKIVGYADAGSTVTVHVDSDAQLNGLLNGQFIASFSVAGALIDCNTATPCAPIVTQ